MLPSAFDALSAEQCQRLQLTWLVSDVQLGVAGVGAFKGVHVAALGWKAHLFAGGVARGVAVGSLYPVDSVKTKLQVGKPVSFKLSEIGHEHFTGFRAAILGQIPYGMLVFGTYETLKAKIFARWHDAPKLPVFIGCAMVGDIVGYFLSALNPQPCTLHPAPHAPQPLALDHHTTLHSQPSTLNPHPSTLNPHSAPCTPQSSTLNPFPSTLNPAPCTPHPSTSQPSTTPQPSSLSPQPSFCIVHPNPAPQP